MLATPLAPWRPPGMRTSLNRVSAAFKSAFQFIESEKTVRTIISCQHVFQCFLRLVRISESCKFLNLPVGKGILPLQAWTTQTELSVLKKGSPRWSRSPLPFIGSALPHL